MYVFGVIGKLFKKTAMIIYLIFIKKKLTLAEKLAHPLAYYRSIVLALSLKRRTGAPVFTRPRVLLGLNSSCNFKCIFCLAHSPLYLDEESGSLGITPQTGSVSKRSNPHMDFEVFKSLIDDLEYLEPLSFSLSGNGETLGYPFIGEAMEYLRSKSRFNAIWIGFSTNGELLSDKIAKKILENNINEINFSFNASNEATYAAMHSVNGERFNKVIHNVKQFVIASQRCNKKPSISASFVLTKINHKEIVEMIKMCDLLGIKRVNFILMYFCLGRHKLLRSAILDDQDKEDLKNTIIAALVESKKRRIFTNLESILAKLNSKSMDHFKPSIKDVKTVQIHASGITNPYDFPYPMGNIYERSIIDIWYSPEYTKFRSMIREKILKKGYMSNRPFCFRCDMSKTDSELCKIVF